MESLNFHSHFLFFSLERRRGREGKWHLMSRTRRKGRKVGAWLWSGMICKEWGRVGWLDKHERVICVESVWSGAEEKDNKIDRRSESLSLHFAFHNRRMKGKRKKRRPFFFGVSLLFPLFFWAGWALEDGMQVSQSQCLNYSGKYRFSCACGAQTGTACCPGLWSHVDVESASNSDILLRFPHSHSPWGLSTRLSKQQIFPPFHTPY